MGVLHKILNPHTSKKDEDFFNGMEEITGFPPKNLTYYKRAFTHKSLQKKDKQGNPYNFERLEFLGDAILDAQIGAYLFKVLPEADEGQLTKMRAKIVSRKSFNQIGQRLGLLNFLTTDIHQNQLGENIYGNLLEALVGAIYMDRGYKGCKKFIRRKMIHQYVDLDKLDGKIMSYKSHLIEWCQKEKKTITFKSTVDNGCETEKYFAITLLISNNIIAKARSTSKKKAEEKAAKRAYFALQEKINHF